MQIDLSPTEIGGIVAGVIAATIGALKGLGAIYKKGVEEPRSREEKVFWGERDKRIDDDDTTLLSMSDHENICKRNMAPVNTELSYLRRSSDEQSSNIQKIFEKIDDYGRETNNRIDDIFKILVNRN
jgi:hypothetical protein